MPAARSNTIARYIYHGVFRRVTKRDFGKELKIALDPMPSWIAVVVCTRMCPLDSIASLSRDAGLNRVRRDLLANQTRKRRHYARTDRLTSRRRDGPYKNRLTKMKKPNKQSPRENGKEK